MIPVETVMNRDIVTRPKTFTVYEAARLRGSRQIEVRPVSIEERP